MDVKCPVPEGSFLYAPATWYHSTCHLDPYTVNLLSHSFSPFTKLELGAVINVTKGEWNDDEMALKPMEDL